MKAVVMLVVGMVVEVLVVAGVAVLLAVLVAVLWAPQRIEFVERLLLLLLLILVCGLVSVCAEEGAGEQGGTRSHHTADSSI